MRKFTSNNLARLGNSVSVSLPKDENGLIGRECPQPDCEGYFKVKSGTGLTEPGLPCHCPYCGVSAPQDHFYTKEQIEYAHSVALRKVADALHQDLKSLEFESKPSGGFGIGISMKVKKGASLPIRSYREKKLETHVTCDSCTLEYAVYGVFAYCPDCGSHNSLQILERNLSLARRMIELSQDLEEGLQRHLLENALEDCVSAFDGFGRELCLLNAQKATDANKAAKVSFQNLVVAEDKLKSLFGWSLESKIGQPSWQELVRAFQVRHLIAHRMGVVDEEYKSKSGDQYAISGRKVELSLTGVSEVIDLVLELSKKLAACF